MPESEQVTEVTPDPPKTEPEIRVTQVPPARLPSMEPIPSNYYDLFGLEHRLALDPRDLEKRFYSLSRKFHPDLYTLKSPEEQQYALEFDSELGPHDKQFEIDGIKLVVDKKSYLYLNGTTLDYVQQGLTGGFTFVNPKAKSSCGCGTSFSA